MFDNDFILIYNFKLFLMKMLFVREVSFMTTRRAPGIWGGEHIILGDKKGRAQKSFSLKGGRGQKIFIKKNF